MVNIGSAGKVTDNVTQVVKMVSNLFEIPHCLTPYKSDSKYGSSQLPLMASTRETIRSQTVMQSNNNKLEFFDYMNIYIKKNATNFRPCWHRLKLFVGSGYVAVVFFITLHLTQAKLTNR